MEKDVYVAFMCEGEAERAIIDILIDNNKLIYTREELLEEEPIKRCSAKEFERKYLRKSFQGKISLYRIIDRNAMQIFNSLMYQVHKSIISYFYYHIFQD